MTTLTGKVLTIVSLQIVLLLIGSVFLSIPGQVEGETSDRLAKGSSIGDFFEIEFPEGGGRDSTLSILIPNSGPILSTNLYISNVPGKPGPSKIMVDVEIDNHNEWYFGGGAEGKFGDQDSFIDGNKIIRDELELSGNTYSFILPIEAKIKTPRIKINSPPSPEVGIMKSFPNLELSTNSMDAIDAGDIDGDGELELIYFNNKDSSIKAIDLKTDGSAEEVTVLKNMQEVTSLRIVDRPNATFGMILLSRNSNKNGVVDGIIGDELDNMMRMPLSQGLPADSPGFTYDQETGSVLILNGSRGTVHEMVFNGNGDPSLKVKINDTRESSSIAEADLDGDGDKDILIFPAIGSDKNITICEAIFDHSMEIFDVYDSGLQYWSGNLGTTLDIDGDGKEEIYVPIGDDGDITSVYFDDIGDLKLNWIGLNDTVGVPRKIGRDLYGNGSIYSGMEGFLYISTPDSLYHVLPRDGPDSEYMQRMSNTIGSWSLLGTSTNDVKSISIENRGVISYSSLEWSVGRDIAISSFGTETAIDVDIGQTNFAIMDLSPLMIESENSPHVNSAAGNTFVRYDLRIEGQGGYISLNDLEIEYDLEIDAANSLLFRPAIQAALERHDREDVLISLTAESAGTIRIGPVHVDYDSPPVVHTELPGSVHVMEDAPGTSLFNIRDHVSDDYLLPQGLDIELVLEEDFPTDYLFLDRNGNIVSQPFKYPDLYGEYQFAFTISDLRNSIQTEPVTLVIEPTQDVPVLIGNIDEISVEEGSGLNILLSGEEGLFMDPDGDDLSFSWTVTNPQPLALEEHIEISLDDNALSLEPQISGTGGDMRLEIEVSDGTSSFSEGPLAVIKVNILNVDSAPTLGTNPGTVYLIEDQDTPSRIPLVGWFLDPDTSLSEYQFSVYSPTPYLETYIKHVGGDPYLFLHPQGDLNGEITVMLEMSADGTNIMDRLKVVIGSINDKPEVFVDGKELIKNRGWMLAGHVRDRDSEEGIVEYRVGDGEWISAWGYESWSLIVNFHNLPIGGGFIFIRAFDHEEYSVVTYVKLTIPEEMIPPPPPPPYQPDDNPDDKPPIDRPGENDDTGFTPTPHDSSDPPWALYGGIAGIIIAAIFFFGFTEVGMIIMATVGASIYSKLSKKDILNHEIRGLIRGYIIANPGDHYSSIKRNLDLNNGTLAYHLRVLEQSGFIKSMYDGIYKRYYPSNVNISKLKKNVSKQEEIFNIILDNPGVTMEEIGRMIGVSRQVVNYHVKNLIRAGVVSYQRDRKSARFFPSDDGGNGFEHT